jgi:hypothetical protein
MDVVDRGTRTSRGAPRAPHAIETTSAAKRRRYRRAVALVARNCQWGLHSTPSTSSTAWVTPLHVYRRWRDRSHSDHRSDHRAVAPLISSRLAESSNADLGSFQYINSGG